MENNQDDILELYASDLEFNQDDDTSHLDIVQERIVIKLFTRGNSSRSKRIRWARFLNEKKEIEVLGCYFKRNNAVLFEVALCPRVEAWLVLLFEERQKIPLNETNKARILELSDGKFQFIIDREIVNMIVLGDAVIRSFQCQVMNPSYGLSNGGITNFFLGIYEKQSTTELMNFVKAIKSKPFTVFDSIIGFRIERNENYNNTSRIRCIIDQSIIDDKLLNDLKAVFGSITFSSSTVHLLLKQLWKVIDSELASKDGFNFDIFLNRDIIFTNEKEMAAVSKVRIEEKIRKKADKKENIKNSRNRKNLNLKDGSKKNIFERLGPKSAAVHSEGKRNVQELITVTIA